MIAWDKSKLLTEIYQILFNSFILTREICIMNQSKNCELNFDFKSIENLEVVVTKITGAIDLTTLSEIGEEFRRNIPLEFDWNVIFDLREADDQLTDDDGTKVFEQVFKARYFLRKRYAVVHGDTSVNRSRK